MIPIDELPLHPISCARNQRRPGAATRMVLSSPIQEHREETGQELLPLLLLG
jgi:hypothetical protein